MFLMNLCLLLILSKTAVASCIGYQFRIKYARSCNDGDHVIELINSSIAIDECGAVSNSCSKIKAYKTAMVETKIYKGNILTFNKTIDFCDPKAKKSDMLKVGLGLFAIPFSCSYNDSETFCFKGKKFVTFNESTLRLIRFFPINGNIATIKIIVTHDNGKSCFEAESQLVKD